MSDEIVVEQPKSLTVSHNLLPEDSGVNESNTRTSMPSSSDVWDQRYGTWALIKDKTTVSANCYPKLELLSISDKLIIIRQFKLYNRDNDQNRYLIKDRNGENLFYGIEKSVGCCDCCGGNRSFHLTLYDRNKSSALHLERPLRFGSCGLFPFCLQQIIIKGNEEQMIGKVKEKYNPFRLSLEIVNENNETELKVIGPHCRLSCIGDDIHFDIHLNDDNKSKCGHICKKSEILVGGHIFNIKFELDLDVKLKASIIAATILIDYYYYEQPIHEHKYHKLTITKSESLTPFPLAVDYNRKKSNE